MVTYARLVTSIRCYATSRTCLVLLYVMISLLIYRKMAARKLYTCPTSTTFAAKPLPVVVLRSFPGSGNTWVRMLLQLATGIFTGSVYDDENLRENGFAGEFVRNGSVVVIKTHFDNPRSRISLTIRGTILVLRNGTEACLAEYSRQQCEGHTCNAHDFSEDAFNTYQTGVFHLWFDFNFGIIKKAIASKTCHLLIVRYHRLKKHTAKEVMHMLRFLKMNAKGAKCVRSANVSLFKRKQRSVIGANAQSKYYNSKIAQMYDSVDEYEKICPHPGV